MYTEESEVKERVVLTPKELLEKIASMVPAPAGFVKAEFEGPDIVVYLKNIKEIYRDETTVRNIATSVKKKLIIRSDSASLMPKEKAEELVRQIIPQDATIASVRFVPEFSEVCIEAMKPGLVIGKHGSNLKRIITETGWAPKVLRTPTMSSDMLTRVRNLMFNEAEFRKKFMVNIGKNINRPIVKSEWLKATALGGFKEVGRSCLLLETTHSKILIDCGISPEPAAKGVEGNSSTDVNKAFPYLDNMNFPINELDAVVVTHAHMDHTGFIPYLFRCGYDGPVYCTPPTRDLAALLLSDYLKLTKRYGVTPPYEDKDIKKMLMHTVTRDYGEVTNITDELKLTYHPAGHVLGSATAHLHVGDGMYNIVHTGDLKYGFTRLYDPAATRYPRVDTLFIESTYGGSNNITKNRDEAERDIMHLIKSTVDRKGKVLIPVFSLGRAQEVQMVLENYMMNKPEFKMDVPVYLDGMILECSAMHTAYPEYLKESLRNRILNNRSPFESEIFEINKGSRDDIMDRGPAIILASGGMLNGGAALDYFHMLADSADNTVIFVGYNSPSSLGRRIQNGTREVPLPNEDGKLVPVKININVRTEEGFSGHSDRRELMRFVENMKPRARNVYTMHGEEHRCEDLARSIGRALHVDVRAPMNLDSMRLK